MYKYNWFNNYMYLWYFQKYMFGIYIMLNVAHVKRQHIHTVDFISNWHAVSRINKQYNDMTILTQDDDSVKKTLTN